MNVEPRAHTPRNPDRATLGGQVGAVARARRRPFLPWQQRAADVVNEIDPTNGLLWYNIVVLHVQRQAGKSDFVDESFTHTGLTKPDARMWYTAQKGIDASDWMREAHERLNQPGSVALFGSPGTSKCRYVLSRRNGREGIYWPHTRARVQVFPPTPEALHSKQADRVYVDEAWAHDAIAGQALRQAIRPTMNTRPGAQLWVVSAGGHAGSDYLNEYLELGRLSLEDPDSRVAFIEYGIPFDSDPTDLDNIYAHHPAAGTKLFTREALDAAWIDFRKDPAGFARAYGTVPTGAREAAFPPGAWAECGTGRPSTPPTPAGIAVDVTPDGTWAAIAIADTAGTRVAAEIAWAGETRDAAKYIDRLPRQPIAYAATNTANLELVDELTRLGRKVTPVGLPNVASACNRITRLVLTRELAHYHQPDLDAAVEHAMKRDAGDGGFIWSRAKSHGSIAELYAVTLAVHQATANPARKPVARVGRL